MKATQDDTKVIYVKSIRWYTYDPSLAVTAVERILDGVLDNYSLDQGHQGRDEPQTVNSTTITGLYACIFAIQSCQNRVLDRFSFYCCRLNNKSE